MSCWHDVKYESILKGMWEGELRPRACLPDQSERSNWSTALVFWGGKTHAGSAYAVSRHCNWSGSFLLVSLLSLLGLFSASLERRTHNSDSQTTRVQEVGWSTHSPKERGTDRIDSSSRFFSQFVERCRSGQNVSPSLDGNKVSLVKLERARELSNNLIHTVYKEEKYGRYFLVVVLGIHVTTSV